MISSDHPRQDTFINSQEQNMSSEDYDRHLAHLRKVARDEGVDRVLNTYGVDVILGPTDCGLTSMATAGGKISAAQDRIGFGC
jgi:amidase